MSKKYPKTEWGCGCLPLSTAEEGIIVEAPDGNIYEAVEEDKSATSCCGTCSLDHPGMYCLPCTKNAIIQLGSDRVLLATDMTWRLLTEKER